ncbi:putrescine oxidase [Variibacter gotjawalensis]|uniref:Tryptophan 2-monooxygenase n=1 Tax=Variibacter gotjawalensis TaxID=1333996 RepID=A0A0S3PVT5_9BRAD|nr:NAD(P)/FAD-dependent oxidoreductase [Variibacter gotjawalensis]NIK45841.1 monoamine oxidase [Variibacter gotjawalensis]RZS47765.1 monoamine oxidase [Variibacter gotjawalensis]BAT60019.1 putrescine oxidase [Variibacter gotjawalensis]
MHEIEVIVIGAGAAGVAAGRRLKDHGVNAVVLEARDRVGGRAATVAGELPLDLGCGWLHSAEENEWTGIARELGLTIDTTFPPWNRIRNELSMSAEEQTDFRATIDQYETRVEKAAREKDRAASTLLEPGNPWNALISAISTYANGVEADKLSVVDYDRYYDSGTNWRVTQGYGTTVAGYAKGLDIRLGEAVSRIDHSGKDIRVTTTRGELSCRAIIVTISTNLLARETLRFDPPLPEKIAAAGGLPLGLADKLFFRIERPDDFPKEGRVFGTKDRIGTGSYHFRPFGRPVIECYFGGENARAMEKGGIDAQVTFAREELANHFGHDVLKRLKPIISTQWAQDPFALGSYSAALIGHADARAALAAPVDDRIFFAGEAVSARDFTTAHGALRTGRDAADAAHAALRKA